MYTLLNRYWTHIESKRKIQLIMLMILMIVSSFAEIMSIGSIFPFLAVLMSPEKIYSLTYLSSIKELLSIRKPEDLIIPITVLFCLAAVGSGAIRLLLLFVNTRLSYAIGSDISVNIYRKTLYQPYSVHVSRNSSEIISGISNKTGMVTNAISSILTLISSSVILISIMITLIIINPITTVYLFGALSVIYGFIILFTKKQLSLNSTKISKEITNVIKYLQEGLGGIRDVLIDGSQDIFCEHYRAADKSLRKSQGDNIFLGNSPRYFLEAFGMTAIGMIAYTMMHKPDGLTKVVPVLGLMALGAQRMLPILQQVYSSWSNIKGTQDSLSDAIILLEQEMPKDIDNKNKEDILFNNYIYLNNVSFKYKESAPYVLRNISIKIKKGDKLGIVGMTGSGKSTLIDIIMGLLYTTEGELIVDDKIINKVNASLWQKHISHVPQNIFMTDSTIEENIAYGVNKENIDKARVIEVTKKANLSELIESLPEKYDTIVGERGARISGGQKQRIGIARALYKNSKILILDEATSALDNETEKIVMQEIENLGKDLTVIIIAHRITTLKNCDYIVVIESGIIKGIKSYSEIISEQR